MTPSNDIGTLLHEVSSSLDKRSDHVLHERLGIGLSQFRILLSLLQKDGQNQSSIAQDLTQTEASISRQIILLKDKKLIVVRRSSSNRRDSLIFLTGKGMMIGQSALSILNNYHSPLFEDLSEHEQKQLSYMLTIIQKHLNYL